MKVKIFLIVLLSMVCVSSINAQKKARKITITGTVYDVYKAPIMNAIVMIDNKKTNSMTDAKGHYKIKVKPTAQKIAIFTLGSGIIEENIFGRTQIDFDFGTMSTRVPELENTGGEEGVNTGYDYVRKRNVNTEMTHVDGSGNKYQKYADIFDMIKSESPGVRIEGENIIIQESRDLYGTVPALLVVDGVYVNSISYLQPSMVESITVLRGTSAAIYGTRGYGGAVVITTKKNN
jgi:TonB-dependent SusC/RagA subfamily outer membrane receptor